MALGIDFGHSHIQVAVAGLAHDILAAFFGMQAPGEPGAAGVTDTETED